MSTPTGTWPVVTDVDFPMGLMCARCDRPINPGQPYGSELHSLDSGGEAIELLVCVYCAGQ